MRPISESKPLSLAYTGLSSQEHQILAGILKDQNYTLHPAKSDMDLWKMTRRQSFDFYLIGQNAQITCPSHLVWFLQDRLPVSKVLALYSKLDQHEADRLREYHIAHTLLRPLEGEPLLAALEKISFLFQITHPQSFAARQWEKWTSFLSGRFMPHPASHHL